MYPPGSVAFVPLDIDNSSSSMDSDQLEPAGERYRTRLPSTDASATSDLWRDVQRFVSTAKHEHTMMATRRGKGKPAIGPGSYATPPASSPDLIDPDESASQTTTKSTVTIRSRDFANLILKPRGIRILCNEDIVPQQAHKHFGTAPVVYTSLPGLEDASVWASAETANSIAGEYKAMSQMQGYNEDEYTQVALERLLHNESKADKVSGERKPRAERLLKLTCKPSANGRWRIPPTVAPGEPAAAAYTWDVRADVSFWIQNRSFSEDYLEAIPFAVHVIPQSITCPYLTVEFKRHNEDESQAQRQAVAAGAMALYNRFRLHSRARTCTPQHASALSDVRHYAMTACCQQFAVYVLKPVATTDDCPSGDERWAGCDMELLASLDMTRPRQAALAISWINEIHRWGLTRHLRSCENDIKVLLQGQGDVDTSDLYDLSSI